MEKQTPAWWMVAFMKVIGYGGILAATVVTSVLQVGYFPTLEKLNRASVKCDVPMVNPSIAPSPQAHISLLLPSERSEQSA
jgi:hypothetical protein